MNVVAPGERFTVGPFDCSLLRVTHSIPESHALALRTPLGNVLHTGDWKLDPAPLVGALTATDDLEAFGREGVLAMVAGFDQHPQSRHLGLGSRGARQPHRA